MHVIEGSEGSVEREKVLSMLRGLHRDRARKTTRCLNYSFGDQMEMQSPAEEESQYGSDGREDVESISPKVIRSRRARVAIRRGKTVPLAAPTVSEEEVEGSDTGGEADQEGGGVDSEGDELCVTLIDEKVDEKAIRTSEMNAWTQQ